MPKDYRKRSKKSSSSGGTPPWFWMLIGFAPGILIAVLLYLDKTDPVTHSSHKAVKQVKQQVRTATRAQTLRASKKREVEKTASNKKSKQPDDTGKVKFTFYEVLVGNETTIGDRQIKREARKYRLAQQKKRRAERKRLRLLKARQRRERLAKKRKKQKIAAAKRKKAQLKRTRNQKKRAATKNANKRKSRTVAKIKKKPKRKKSIKANRFPNYILIQAGSFRKKKQAEKRKAKLALYGVSAAISLVKIKGETWFRVRVGPFHSYKDMKVKLARLRKKKINVMSIRVKH